MNFRLARNAVCKYPIFAHVDNAYANIPLTKPPTDEEQRLSANGYRSPNQKGRCPLFLLYASDVEWYEEASWQLRRGVSAATQGRFVIILTDEFLAK